MDATKLTGLWKVQNRQGNTYLKGSLNAIAQVIVMPNTFKKEEDTRSPDYFLYVVARNKDEGKAQQSQPDL